MRREQQGERRVKKKLHTSITRNMSKPAQAGWWHNASFGPLPKMRCSLMNSGTQRSPPQHCSMCRNAQTDLSLAIMSITAVG